MGYDFRTGSSSYAGSIDPLTSPKPVYDLTQVVRLWSARTSVSKIILGYLLRHRLVDHDQRPNATVINGSACSPVLCFLRPGGSLARRTERTTTR